MDEPEGMHSIFPVDVIKPKTTNPRTRFKWQVIVIQWLYDQAGFEHRGLALALGQGQQAFGIMESELVWRPFRFVIIKWA